MIDLDIDDVGLHYAEAIKILCAAEAANVHLRANYEPVPAGVISSGELCRLLLANIAMSLQLYPSLTEEGVMESIIRKAIIAGAGGSVN